MNPQMSIDSIQSAKLKNVKHGFFGRSGGSSSGLFSSLNGGKFVGDDLGSVQKNLEDVRVSLGADILVTLKQIHSSKCLIVENSDEMDQEADAMVTNIKGIALGVVTADCAPLLFFDKTKNIVGAAHSGWKGAVGGVIESTLDCMQSLGSDLNDVVVAIGPCIHVGSYEVDDDYLNNFPNDKNCFEKIEGKYHFDLPKYCIGRLIDRGIHFENIDVVNVDTFQNPQKYFSFRYANKYSGGVCGRNLSVICL